MSDVYYIVNLDEGNSFLVFCFVFAADKIQTDLPFTRYRIGKNIQDDLRILKIKSVINVLTYKLFDIFCIFLHVSPRHLMHFSA